LEGTVIRSSAPDLAAAAAYEEPAGVGAYAAPEIFPATNEAFFPLAVGILPAVQSELAVTNHAVTATSRIELVMVDQNGQLRPVHLDPEPLCAGETRWYDIDQLAGPLTGGGRGGAPYVSLRVTSLPASEGSDPPPVAATLKWTSAAGTAAYAGFTGESPLGMLGRRDAIGGVPVIVIPDIRVGVGEPAVTTVLALTNPRATGNNIQVYADFFDATGQLVVKDAFLNVRSGSGTVVDTGGMFQNLAGDRLQLPAGFRGTVFLRSTNPRTPLGALAINFPRRDGPGADGLEAHPGALILRSADPNAPTPTPTWTLRPPSETATPTPTVEATATEVDRQLYLPFGQTP
jgi:hypothetical protein